MSDYPHRGDAAATREWLDKEGFTGFFVGWKADALLGIEKEDIIKIVGETGLMLWGLLNTARQAEGKLSRNLPTSFQFTCCSLVFRLYWASEILPSLFFTFHPFLFIFVV
jgi:hypothetical protein